MTSLETKASSSKKTVLAEPLKNATDPSQIALTSYSGPIPPPAFMQQYEQLVPGIAKRFLEEPHIEAEHRRSLERTMVQAQIDLSNRGQIMACGLAMVCIVAAFAAIFLGYDLAGLGALAILIASFAGVFIYSRHRQ